MKRYALQTKDHAILNVIANNARLSYNQIAKATHISKDSVKDRIKKMEENNFIKSYFALINYNKLGIPLVNVYCKLKSIKYASKSQIKPLLKNPHISSVTWLMGKFDLELQIMARKKKDVKTVLKRSGFLSKILEYKISTSGKPEIYSTTTLRAKEIGVLTTEEDKLEILDKKDIELIDLLCINARERIIDISSKLAIKEDEVRYRIKRLIKKGIILGFRARTESLMGASRYLTLIKVKNSLNKSEISSLKSMDNIFYLKRCTGNRDYILRFRTDSNKELVNTFYSLRNIFSKNLVDFKVHTILEIMKFNPSPSLLLKSQAKV